MSTTTPLQVLELKMYAKIMSLLKTKIFAKFRPKVLEICFQILEKQTPSVRLIKPTLSKKIKRRKQTTDFKLIDDIRDNRREEKGASSKGIPSLPSSPYKSENQEEMRNFGYFQLNQLKSDPQLKMEKEIRADVLGMLFTTLTWIKLENEKQEIGRTSSQMPFEFSFIEILTILRSRFKDNNLAINMTVEDVQRALKEIDTEEHMQFIELLFPVLNLETQFTIISKFKFKYHANDPMEETIDLNIFEFLKGVSRSEIRPFMTKIQCPILLLNYINWKLDDELQKDITQPSESSALELFYLFNDFLIKDYSGVFIDGRITRKCNNWCAGNNSTLRKKTDLSNYSDLHSVKSMNAHEKYCHECFGRNNWHELSLEIIKKFLSVFKNHHFSAPCGDINIDEKEIILRLTENEDIKNFNCTPIRNGGIVRLIIQSIMILIKGSVAMKLRDSTYAAICQSAVIEETSSFQFNRKSKQSPLKLDQLKFETSLNTKDEVEFDISFLIDLLEYTCFPSRSSFDGNEVSRKSDEESLANTTLFYLYPPNNLDYAEEVLEQQKYFNTKTCPLIDTSECKSNCFFHDSVKVRANIINEILLILSSTVNYNKKLTYNSMSDFTMFPDEAVLRICKFLQLLCEATMEPSGQSGLASGPKCDFPLQMETFIADHISARNNFLNPNDLGINVEIKEALLEESREEVVDMTPIFSTLQGKSPKSSKVGSLYLSKRDPNDEASKYGEMIEDILKMTSTLEN